MAKVRNISGDDLYVPELDREVKDGESVEVPDDRFVGYVGQGRVWGAVTEPDAGLRGQALDDALDALGLPKTGTAAEKRQRLADHTTDGES